MERRAEKPIIVQSDRTILLEVDNPSFRAARDQLMRFAELVKSPEHIHVYRITALSLWNAAAAGLSSSEILAFLDDASKYPVPGSLRKEIAENLARYGLLKLVDEGGGLRLRSADPLIIREILALRSLREYIVEPIGEDEIGVRPTHRGHLKLALIKIGYPVEDLAGYREGAPLALALGTTTAADEPFEIRGYQESAIEAFYAGGGLGGGSGVIVLPCGAGKTIVGIGVMEKIQTQTLVLTTNITALRQWRRELLDKTSLRDDEIGEYSGEVKEIRPVTLTTYQILTYRKARTDGFVHLDVFSRNNWGLVIYDEVHLLPAPVFRYTAEIQATRRLGLTATLIREDGREDEVFSLIGPKKYDVPWRTLERAGWIANARCVEIRADLEGPERAEYAVASARAKFRIASENTRKNDIVRDLVGRHREDLVLIIGQYLDQLRKLRLELDAPLITGKTPSQEREALYARFRQGEIRCLIVSKVGNFAVDLPDANVAIQISGTFGSRQEEAQRLGRILRPKRDGSSAIFYSIVTRGSRDQEFAEKRQLFLTEQGYQYEIRDGLPVTEPAE
ncbi:MAG: DEAD/DEAH box helicase [Planctomycetes bacterium]|nr:DEAD/DEAH box helicase [Planctomycetota bacterium]